MKAIAGVTCSVISLLLLSGCGEQLASEAQKAADQIKEEATKIASQKIDALKKDTLEQLKKVGGEEKDKKPDPKSGEKPGE